MTEENYFLRFAAIHKMCGKIVAAKEQIENKELVSYASFVNAKVYADIMTAEKVYNEVCELDGDLGELMHNSSETDKFTFEILGL